VASYFAGQLLRSPDILFERPYEPFGDWKLRNYYKPLADLVQKKIRTRYGINCDGKDLYYFAGSAVPAAISTASQELDRDGANTNFFEARFLSSLSLRWFFGDTHQ
jgi:hypothetical protein